MPINSHFLLSCTPWWFPIYLMILDLCTLDSSYKWNYTTYWLLCLTSWPQNNVFMVHPCYITYQDFIDFVMAEYSSSVWIYCIVVCLVFWWVVVLFLCWAIPNCRNEHPGISFCGQIFSFSWVYQRLELLGHTVPYVFNFLKNGHCVSQSTFTILDSPPTMGECFNLAISSATFVFAVF